MDQSTTTERQQAHARDWRRSFALASALIVLTLAAAAGLANLARSGPIRF